MRWIQRSMWRFRSSTVALLPCQSRSRSEAILSRAISMFRIRSARIVLAGIAFRLARLQTLANRYKRVAFVLTNSSTKAAQVGNAVGLDAPASLLNLLRAMKGRRYSIGELPESSDDLIHELLSRGTYDDAYPLDAARASSLLRVRYIENDLSVFQTCRKNADERDVGAACRNMGTHSDRLHPRSIRKLMNEVATKIASMDFEPWSAAG